MPNKALVNPANVSLLAGSSLCGVIHKRAGLKLEEKCKNIGKLEIGNAIVTPALELSTLKDLLALTHYYRSTRTWFQFNSDTRHFHWCI